MLITCTCNDGFEDALTPGKEYRAVELGKGSVLIEDDAGRQRWFGLAKFSFIGAL